MSHPESERFGPLGAPQAFPTWTTGSAGPDRRSPSPCSARPAEPGGRRVPPPLPTAYVRTGCSMRTATTSGARGWTGWPRPPRHSTGCSTGPSTTMLRTGSGRSDRCRSSPAQACRPGRRTRWVLLQQARAEAKRWSGRDDAAVQGSPQRSEQAEFCSSVSLDHVLDVHPIDANPFHWSSAGSIGPTLALEPTRRAADQYGPVSSYAMPGSGGRQPVAYVGPRRTATRTPRTRPSPGRGDPGHRVR